MLNKTDWDILNQIVNIKKIPEGAVNIRLNGESAIRRSSQNVLVTTSSETGGLLVEFKPDVKETVHVPVVLSQSGLQETVHNTFIIGEGSDATILAGCGIHSSCQQTSRHDGLHEIIVKKGGHLKYIENHYGEGDSNSPRLLNPTTLLSVEEGGSAELEMVQIEGVDSTNRKTEVHLKKKSMVKITERLMTSGLQLAESNINIFMSGFSSSADVLSRGVAKNHSRQIFQAALIGQNECNGHLECDAIIMDNAYIQSIPEIRAEDARAILTHEAAIGRIAGEQLIKLMSLGIHEEKAVEMIIHGFLR